MTTTTIQYHGVELQVPPGLAPVLPSECLPMAKWPSFCGAGDGVGNRLVSDYIQGISIKVVCYIHDIEWATTTDTREAFHAANRRFFRNLVALLNDRLSGSQLLWGINEAALYYFAVNSFIGWKNFSPIGGPFEENPVVKDRCRKLVATLSDHKIPISDQLKVLCG